jgi:hypothetical protein
MSRFWLAAFGCISMITLGCEGESPENGGKATAGDERVETSSTSDRSTSTSDECPADWPGPWTACPEAERVRLFTERAGYRITGDTGSALVARGNGWSFYIWATERKEDGIDWAAREKTGPPLGQVGGVEIYGDENLRRWWVVDGTIVWIEAGPNANSRIPPLEEMESLVRASTLSP